MYYAHNFSFELGSFAASGDWFSHIQAKVMSDIDRIIRAEEDINNIPVTYTPADLTYHWAINLELGVETMAIRHKDLRTPLLVVDCKTPWKDQPHHLHMTEFVNHHIGQSESVQRAHAVEFILRQLNEISKWALRMEIEKISVVSTTDATVKALRTLSTVP